MKKIRLILRAALITFFSFACLSSCDFSRDYVISPKTYFGIVRTINGLEGLYLNIPNFGVFELPKYESGESIDVEEGDLISLSFASEPIFSKSYPGVIATPFIDFTVRKKNIELESVDDKYLLIVDFVDDLKEDFAAREKQVGDVVSFVGEKGVVGTGSVPSVQYVYQYCRATIEKMENDRLSVRLHLEQNDTIDAFLREFAYGRISLWAEFE